MAEAFQFRKSMLASSDIIPEHFCDPCNDSNGEFKPVEGHCIDCGDNLCVECFTYHLRPKPFRHHRLKEKCTKPRMMSKPQLQLSDSAEKCLEHHSEIIQSFCISHQKLCCKVCRTIKHKACDIKDVSELAENMKDLHKLENLDKQLAKLRERYNGHLTKTGTHELTVQKTHTNAINDMMKLREEFNKVMMETEKQADNLKEKDLKKIETVSTTCNIVIEQIDKTNKHLDTLKEKNENESLFIAMHHAEGQLQSLEDSLKDLDSENTVREYKFEPDEKFQTMLKDLEVLGKLHFSETKKTEIKQTKPVVISTQMIKQMAKTPVYEKDINVKAAEDKDFEMLGLAVLPNNQILITDWQNQKVKLINTHKNKIKAEIKLSGWPVDITTITADQVAVTQNQPYTIQMLNVSKNKLKLGRKIAVNGHCWGIAYNAKDQTFIVTFVKPVKVEVIDMAGTVIRSIEKDSKGADLFNKPLNVTLSPDRSGIYISDCRKQSVMFMTLSGEVKTVYKDSQLVYPEGICVDKSGLVYVAGCASNTVHQIEPSSGKFKLLLDHKDGLDIPSTIGYCDVEDKLYVGLQDKHVVKVFKMK